MFYQAFSLIIEARLQSQEADLTTSVPIDLTNILSEIKKRLATSDLQPDLRTIGYQFADEKLIVSGLAYKIPDPPSGTGFYTV